MYNLSSSPIDIERGFFSMLMQAPAAVAIVNGPRHVYTFANPQYERIFGRDQQQLVGRSISEIWPEIYYQGIIQMFDNVFASGESFKANDFKTVFEAGGVMKTGYYDFIAEPIKGNGGEVTDVIIHAIDVTEKTLARRKLAQSEERFAAAIKAIEGVLWTNNSAGQMEEEQSGWAALTGQTYQEYSGYGWANAVHPEDAQPTITAWNEAVSERKPFLFEHRVKRKDGAWRLFSIRAIPVLGEDGSIREWIGVHTDITEQRHSEEQIRQSEQRFQNLVREANVGIIVLVGHDMKVEIVNSAYAKLIDRNADDLLGKKLFEVIPEAEGYFRPIIDQVRNSGEALHLYDTPYFVWVAGKKLEGFLNLVYQPYKEADGIISGVMVLCQDVTQSVNAKKALQEVEQDLRNMILQSPVGICLLDAETLVSEIVNESFVEVAGKPYEAIVGNMYWDTFSEDKSHYEAALTEVIISGKPYYANELELKLMRHGKEEIVYVTFVYEPMMNSDGQVKKVAVWVLENTMQVLARQGIEKVVALRTQELAEANLALARNNQELEQFAYIASHDLQEPLRKVSTFTEILKRHLGQVDQSSLNYLKKITDSTARMTQLIGDVLNFSKLSNERELSEPVDLNSLMTSLITDFEIVIDEKKAKIIIEDLPTVTANALQMRQLFANLLSNALKFTKGDAFPTIMVSAQHLSATEKRNYPHLSADEEYWLIDFQDNGIGFSQEYAESIFQIFQRLHTRNEFAGTGIGLALCKKILQNHNGEIWATSKENSGTTFHIILPNKTSRTGAGE